MDLRQQKHMLKVAQAHSSHGEEPNWQAVVVGRWPDFLGQQYGSIRQGRQKKKLIHL